jgi:hypothetical protein
MVYNDNLAKLKDLTEKICLIQEENNLNCDCKALITEINNIIDIETKTINVLKTKNEKFNCYQRMFESITNLIKKFK